MSRLWQSGCEVAGGGGTDLIIYGPDGQTDTNSAGNEPHVVNDVKRSGRGSILCQRVAAGNFSYIAPFPFNTVSGRGYYWRACLRFDSAAVAPSNPYAVLGALGGPVVWAHVKMLANGTLQLYDQGDGEGGGNAAVGSPSAAVTAGPWYVLEMYQLLVTSVSETIGFRLDGVTIAADTVTGKTSPFTVSAFAAGFLGSGAGDPGVNANIWVDDCVLNDSLGSAPFNTWSGDTAIISLMPASDYGRVGFTGGAGATTNLYDAVNNTPPAGKSAATATNTSQIKSANANSTDYYEANLDTPASQGVLSGDTIQAIHAFAVIGSESTTALTAGLSMTAPVIAEATGSTNVPFGVGTWPTLWNQGGALSAPGVLVQENPSLAYGDTPRIKFRRASSEATGLHCCQLGAYIEVVPAPHTDVAAPAANATASGAAPLTTTAVLPKPCWAFADVGRAFALAPLVDNFDRTDADPAPSPWGAAPISTLGGTGAANLKIASNTLAKNASSFQAWGYYGTASYGIAVEVFYEIRAVLPTGAFYAIATRLPTADTPGAWPAMYEFVIQQASSGATINAYSPPSTQRAIYPTATSGITPSVGDLLMARSIGPTHEFWVNHAGGWTLIARAFDYPVSTSGYVSVEFSTSPQAIDNLHAGVPAWNVTAINASLAPAAASTAAAPAPTLLSVLVLPAAAAATAARAAPAVGHPLVAVAAQATAAVTAPAATVKVATAASAASATTATPTIATTETTPAAPATAAAPPPAVSVTVSAPSANAAATAPAPVILGNFSLMHPIPMVTVLPAAAIATATAPAPAATNNYLVVPPALATAAAPLPSIGGVPTRARMGWGL